MAEKRTTRDNESRAKTPARRKPWAPPSKLAMPDAPAEIIIFLFFKIFI